MLLTYGLKDGELTHVSKVDLGLACGCICPDEDCKARLVAKNRIGNKKAIHFAHESGATCEGAVESAKHLLAKEIIRKSKRICLPSIEIIDFNNPPNEKEIKGRVIEFDKIVIEKGVKVELTDRFIPDIKCFKENGAILFVEIANTHFVDTKKGDKLVRAGVSTIEIDISDLELDEELIKRRVEMPSEKKKWLFNQAFAKTVYLGVDDYPKLIYDERLENQLQREMKSGDSFVEIIGNKTSKCPKVEFERHEFLKEFKRSEHFGHGVLRSIVEKGGWDGVIHVNSANGKYILLNGQKKFLYLSASIYFLDKKPFEESKLYEEGLGIISDNFLIKRHGFCNSCSFNKKRYPIFHKIKSFRHYSVWF